MSGRRVVLDASVGVKWFRNEPGSDDARELLEQAADADVALAAPTHFAHEVLSVVRRDFGPADIMNGWVRTVDAVALAPLTREQVAEAAEQCEALGCSFYDALAPALASLLDAELVSADAAAHGAYPGVRLIG
ncbi:MAG: type II toxin-antitoxin system VapC family toxin [Actinobacteria bacterium]|nr:MAG: type II toxin-antitoxin system VapC family toxin [Actinomycetota bacterium]